MSENYLIKSTVYVSIKINCVCINLSANKIEASASEQVEKIQTTAAQLMVGSNFEKNVKEEFRLNTKGIEVGHIFYFSEGSCINFTF